MDWCSVYLTPQALSKYSYLSPPLIFPTTSTELGQKNRPVWITPGAAPLRWLGPIRNPRWEQKRTEGYVIVSSHRPAASLWQPLSHNVVSHERDSKSYVNYSTIKYRIYKLFVLIIQTGVLRLGQNDSSFGQKKNTLGPRKSIR